MHGRLLRYTKYGLWTSQSKVICQRQIRRNAPYKWLKLPQDLTFPLSPPIRQTSHTVLFSFLKKTTCFTTFSLCGNSFLQSQRARALTLTTGIVARIWHSHHRDKILISGWELKLCFKPLQAKATRDQGPDRLCFFGWWWWVISESNLMHFKLPLFMYIYS